MKLDDFLKCKKVRCVNIGGHVYITAGKEYDVINLDEDSVYIVNDNHEECDYLYKYFEPVLDSAENPPQDVELTPETEASEPKFKVGDKVYLFGTNYIEEITKIIGANVYLAGADFDASVSVKEICHANPENRALLSKLYPHIEFEQPAKELKGSDLARALIKKGWVGFNCLGGHSGDENAITETIVIGINNDGKFTTIDGRLFSNAIPMMGWLPLKAQEVGL